ncbi:MAG: inositol monophosphatase [Gemmatimonadota bacterium]|nr:inositol monophosphatase [Gemmatimonadota bacterium]
MRVAQEAAMRAASHIRALDRPDRAAWQLKGRRDFVTEVDLACEEIIREILVRETPDAVIVGEETSPDAEEATLTWVVDPLDGTINFLHRYPAVGVSVAAVADGELVAGVVVDVFRDGVYVASRGDGASCEGQRLQVSDVAEPSQALIGTGFPFKVPELLPPYLRQFTEILQRTSGIRRAGAASLDFVDLALGRVDGFWELYLAPWDVAAGALIVREAGGFVSGLDGDERPLRHGGYVAGNPKIYQWLMELLTA